MKHHEFSPSRLEQFRLCPGSYYMQQGLPEEENEWAKEGTLLHNAVATGCLDGLNDEQATVVQKCLNFLKTLIEPGDQVFYEEKVTIKDENGNILTEGIVDVIIFNPEKHKAVTIDWKFGYNPVKNVSENIQVATYAVGVMQRFGVQACDAYVFQPRIHQKSHYQFSNADAIISNIRNIIKRAQSRDLVLKPSESACRYCRARLNCPAFRLNFQRISACRPDYDLSDIPTLVSLYEASKEAKSFISEVEAAVKKVIEDKGRCGNYVFQTAEGAREVKDLNALYAVVKDYLTPAEFNSVCKITLGKFETTLSQKLIAEAAVKGEAITKTEAKSRCYAMIAPLISRGNPTKKIVEEVA